MESRQGATSVKEKLGRQPVGRRLALILAVAGIAIAPAACGDDGNGDDGNDGASASEVKCGSGNGQKASGAPIKIGAIVTKQPGIDFTDSSNMAQAFFECVNDNGGIGGRPVEYLVETEQTDPAQVGALAEKLVQDEGVVAMVGSFSLIDCSVNHRFYESKDFYVINAGVAAECYATPNSAPVNMGPRYSADGAVQALLDRGIKKLVFATPKVPGAEYIAGGPGELAEAAGIPYEAVMDETPVKDANSVALKLVQAAGEDGGVVLNNTPPEVLKVFQAAQQQGLQDRVTWGCSTSCNTDFLAEALGSDWNGKLFVNAELNLVDAQGRDNELYRQVRERYGSDIPLGSYSQMGFLMAKIATDRLLTIDGEITPKSANTALLETKDYETDLLCEPWYYLEAPLHIPNNTDRTVTPQDGRMVSEEGCFEISADDPAIARVRAIEEQRGL